MKSDFFTFDPIRMFYVNVDMPPDAPIEETLAHSERVSERIRPLIRDDELRAMTVMAGIRFSDAEALFGDHYGQIQVSLNPKGKHDRSVSDIVDAVRDTALSTPGDAVISLRSGAAHRFVSQP